MNYKRIIISLAILGLIGGVAFAISCGSSSSDDTTATDDVTTTDASISFPSGMAIASPTTGSTASASISASTGVIKTASVTADSTFEAKTVVFDAIIAAGSDTACQVTLPVIAAATGPNCYGPTLDYADHIDCTGTCVPDGDQTDIDAALTIADTDGDGQLPSGDLGIWTASEASGEACAAAEINYLVENTAVAVDYTMLLQASMVCLMENAGTALPSTDGDLVTLTTELNTAVQANNPNITITTATLENLTDVADTDGTTRDVYKYTIVIVDTVGSNTITTTSYLKHMPTAADNTTYKGKLWAEIDGASGAGDKTAFSIAYARPSLTSLKYKMMAAIYANATTSTTIFDSTGNIDVSGDWTGNMSQTISNYDPSTRTGSFSYGWSAGTGGEGSPEEARIFNAYATATSGCGFFGYGLGFDQTNGTASDNVIDGFICNWAGPGNDHSMTGTRYLAQKQCMTKSSSSGLLEFDVLKNKITYAPTVSCAGDGTMAVKLSDVLTFTTATQTYDLVDLITDTDFAGYTAPTAPDLPSGY